MYLEFGDIKIPCGMVTAFSYTLKARLGERYDGKVFTCGFEAPEVSMRVFISPANCALFGLSFQNAVSGFLGMDISRKTTPKTIKIGDFVPCRGFLFAPTSINFSTNSEAQEFEFDLVLSPVKNALSSETNRASAGKNQLLPRVELVYNEKSLALCDEISFTELTETTDGCFLSVLIGDDSRLAAFETWAGKMSDGGGLITIETSEKRKYYCTTADLLDGVFSLSGSIYPPAAFVPVTKTYINTDICDILRDIAGMFGFRANVQVSGLVQYFLLDGTPIEAIANLQNSAGFLVSATAGEIAFVPIPDGDSFNFVTLTAIPLDDEKAERFGGCRWTDGTHEYIYKDGEGPLLICKSCFCANIDKFAKQRARLENYRNRMFKADLPIDLRVVAHSPVSVQTRSELRSGLVEYFLKDYIGNAMELHINTLGDL